mmetsp:Transcript_33833/g.79064  ORF Transcript_33833/g.79064 Transcript_33833/m.79064 type:complete len:114 (+) Transcript_33833:539-880(+)
MASQGMAPFAHLQEPLLGAPVQASPVAATQLAGLALLMRTVAGALQRCHHQVADAYQAPSGVQYGFQEVLLSALPCLGCIATVSPAMNAQGCDDSRSLGPRGLPAAVSMQQCL